MIKYKSTLLIWIVISIIFYITYQQGLSFANKIYNGALYTWNGRTGEWWRVVTYGFLHNNTHHFLGNLILGLPLMLYLENKTNGVTAYMLFLLGIVAGGIGFLLFNEKLYVITLGASAGIWAMLSASMVLLLSKAKVNLIEFLILFNVTMLLFYDTYTATNVNKVSHVAGYVGGVFVMMFFILLSRKNYLSHTMLTNTK
jgi:membrane associated rhomboid family serine protease